MTPPQKSKRRQRVRSTSRKPLHVRLEPRGRALLIIGAVILVAAYALPRSELLVVGSLLMSLPLIALATVRLRRQRFGVSRRFAPAIAEAGKPVTVNAQVRNLAATRSGEARWRDEWPWAPYGNDPTRLPPLSRNRGSFEASSESVSYVLEPPKRGIVDIGPFVIEVFDPFQLARGEIVLGGTQKLVVTPRVVALPVTGLPIAADDGDSRVVPRQDSGGGDDIMTREYRHGDPMRRVHWKATARQGELMVRQEEQRRRAHAHIVLDTRRSGYRDLVVATEDQPQSDSFEWAVAFTASLALHLQRIGFDVDVLETGFRQLATITHEEEFLVSLAAVTLVEGPPQRRLLSPVVGARHSLGTVFAVVADAEPGTVQRLATQRSQFDSAVAFVVNAHSDLVLGQLRAAGWTCVSVRATDDPAAVWRAAADIREANRALE
ncbi:MAG: DUF58 domain-containing protein [Microbacteriaceae bacterium]|nr:DUF58 domain-containing protein [Microbacteriaceae bacterium]